MCAMNEVNGSAACEDKSLLMGALKTELGFPGFVFPDTNAQKTAYGSISGGLDYGSSSTWSTSTIEAFLNNGSLTEARLDDMVIRNVIGYYKADLDNGEQPSKAGVRSLIYKARNYANWMLVI
jgi:beta-glucosidase